MSILLIFHLRPARLKALACAKAETAALLEDLQPVMLKGGPLSELGGVFWIELPSDTLETARERLPHLGYTHRVDKLEPYLQSTQKTRKPVPGQIIRWRGASHRLVNLYAEDPNELRESAPDRRPFSLETPAGEVRIIRGYRGDSGPLSRRGLAVYDARLLVNLVHCPPGSTFLDPYAGVGGIIIEALHSGYHVLSADIDPSLRPGLEGLGATHYIADARHLPIESHSIDAIATEPPFDPLARQVVIDSFAEMRRLLRTDAKLAMLCALEQAYGIRQCAIELGFRLLLDESLDRKGMECAVFVLGY